MLFVARAGKRPQAYGVPVKAADVGDGGRFWSCGVLIVERGSLTAVADLRAARVFVLPAPGRDTNVFSPRYVGAWRGVAKLIQRVWLVSPYPLRLLPLYPFSIYTRIWST